MALVLHDDDKREYAYDPDSPQTDSKFGAFTQALYDEAKAKGWIVISMKADWKRTLRSKLDSRCTAAPAPARPHRLANA